MPTYPKLAAAVAFGLALSVCTLIASCSTQVPAQSNIPPNSSNDSKQSVAQKPPAQDKPAQASQEFAMNLFTLKATRDAETKVRAAMQIRVPADVIEVPLREFVKQVSTLGKTDVVLDEKRILDAGGDPEAKITANAKNATIETALNRILPRMGLEWLIRNEVVEITTVEWANQHRVSRVYDLRPLRRLLEASPARSAVLTMQLQSGLPQSGRTAGGFGGGPVLINDEIDNRNIDLASLLADDLHSLFFRSFKDVPSFSELEQADLMVVRATQQMHEDFEAYLHTLELVISEQAPKAAIPVHPTTYPFAEDVQIRRALQRKMSVNYNGIPLQDVIKDLGKQSNLPFWLDKAKVTDEGGDPNDTITLHAVDQTLNAILLRLFEPLNLSFLIDQGEIVVTPSANANQNGVTIVYDVIDLTPQDGDMSRLDDVLSAMAPGPWGTGGEEPSQFSERFPGVLAVRFNDSVQQQFASLLEDMRESMQKSPDDQKRKELEKKSDRRVTKFYAVAGEGAATEALKAIMQLVAPDTWDEKSGRTIRKVGQVLVVKHTPRVQGEVQRFLSAYGTAAKDLAEKANKQKP